MYHILMVDCVLFDKIRYFGRDELFAEGYPCGVGGGVNQSDIDSSGVVDPVLLNKGDFEAFPPLILAVDIAALIDRNGARHKHQTCPRDD